MLAAVSPAGVAVGADTNSALVHASLGGGPGASHTPLYRRPRMRLSVHMPHLVMVVLETGSAIVSISIAGHSTCSRSSKCTQPLVPRSTASLHALCCCRFSSRLSIAYFRVSGTTCDFTPPVDACTGMQGHSADLSLHVQLQPNHCGPRFVCLATQRCR
jgi:hypothetical protein